MNGWPSAVATYSPDTTQVVAAAPTPKECPMATRATAMIDELSGFSTEPVEVATTNRASNAWPRRSELLTPVTATRLSAIRPPEKGASFLAMTGPGTRRTGCHTCGVAAVGGLGDFLRARRGGIKPAEVGLPAGTG